MTYSEHLIALITALQDADPSMSDLRLSQEAGIGKGWVSDFKRRGHGVTRQAELVVEAVRWKCPAGPEGDPVRLLLKQFDADDEDRAA